MDDRRDIVRWIADWLLAHEGSITEELALRMEIETREEWGGQEVRVWRTMSGNTGRPPRAGQANGSRESLYRLLKSKGRP